MTTALNREEVTYSELKSGIKGIGLGEEDWFLLIKKNGNWRFSLWNLMPYEALTGWISLSTPEDLRASRKAKIIRDKLKSRWGNASEIIEWIVIEIRYSQTEFSSTGKVDEKEHGRQSQADMLVKLALKNAEQVFHDERQVPYIRLRSSKALRTLRLRSRDVKSWLAGLLWKTYEKAPNQEALGSALNVLEAQCQEGPTRKLYNRVAPGEDGSIWIDMTDEKWRAIHVTKEGWQIVDNPPILFRRYSHQKAIPEPVRGGNVNQILEFANVKNEADRLLFVVTNVTYFIPGIPHVILVFFGPQGSGKTWSLRVIRCLVDPSQLDLLNLPRRPRELMQNLDHHWCSFYDNVGRVPQWCSNVFCRAVTGMGVSKRALYTDDDDVIYSYHRCIGLTDINIAAERGDMLQRSLLLGLYAIPKKQRKTEKELRKAFEHAYPRILGAILDVLVKAIQIYPTIKLEGLHRMADYVVWSCAITEALGIDKKQFLDAYKQNIVQQNLEMVRASPVSDALIKLMEKHPLGWEGTASQLFQALEEKAKELNISTRQKAWPKKPHILSRRLNELAPSLPAVGYEITRGYKEKTRLISINTVGSDGSGEDTDPTDATAGTSESKTGSQLLSVGDKIKIVYDKYGELTRDGLVSKFELADALEGQVDRNEVFQLLEILDKEGKIASKGPEWYRVV